MTRGEKIDAIKDGSPFNRADIAVFTVLVVLVALFMIFVYSERGENVCITTPKGSFEYPLDRDAVIDVDGHLTVVIKDGKVSVSESDCPDKICVHSGKKSRGGEIIACLPNGVVIMVIGASDFVQTG